MRFRREGDDDVIEFTVEIIKPLGLVGQQVDASLFHDGNREPVLPSGLDTAGISEDTAGKTGLDHGFRHGGADRIDIAGKQHRGDIRRRCDVPLVDIVVRHVLAFPSAGLPYFVCRTQIRVNSRRDVISSVATLPSSRPRRISAPSL